MSVYIGQLGAFGLGKETTPGTFVAPSRFIASMLPIPSLAPEIKLIEAKSIISVPDIVQQAAQGESLMKSAKLKFEVGPENIGEILMALFGKVTTTGTGAPYTHTFTKLAAAQMPTYSLWENTNLDQLTFAGGMLNKLEFDIKAGEYLIADADFSAQLYAAGVTETVAYSALFYFKFDQAVIKIGGVAYTDYTEIKVTYDNLVGVDPVLGGSISSNVIYSKGFKVSVNATVVLEDTTEYAKFVAGTASSAEVIFTSTQLMGTTPYSLDLLVDSIMYNAAPRPLQNGKLEVAFTATGIFDFATSETAKATLVNSVATY